MKSQISLENISKCHLLKFLPSMQSHFLLNHYTKIGKEGIHSDLENVCCMHVPNT